MTPRPLADPRLALVPMAAGAAGVGYLVALSPLLIVALIGVAVLLFFVAVKVEAVLLVLVAALPWESLLQYPSETVSLVKVLGLLLMLSYAFRAVRRHEVIRFPPSVLPVLLFAVLVGLSFVVSPDPGAGVGKIVRYALFITFLFLVIQLVDNRAAATNVMRVIVFSASAAAVWGLVAFIQGRLDRAGGPIADPNDFALLMSSLLPLAAYLAVEDKRLRWLWASSFLILAAGVLATLSRGALVGLAALFVWALMSNRIPLRGLGGGALAVISVLVLAFTFWGPLINERIELKGQVAEANADSRQAYWSAALRMAADNPILGVGPDRFGTVSPEYVRDNPIVLPNPVVHNSYLEILAENGALALGAFVAFLAATWSAVSSAYRRARDQEDVAGRRLATALQSTMVVVVVSSVFLSAQVAIPFWLIGGLAAGVAASTVGEPRLSARAALAPTRV